VAGDALALPFAAAAFDGTVAAFSLNHLSDPAAGLSEAARVTRPGGGLAASAYAEDDDHPVKHAVQAALSARGWTPEPWYRALQVNAAPKLATVDAARAAADSAGLQAEVDQLRVPFPDLDATALIAWRLGLAQHAPFFDALPSDADRAVVTEDAATRLGDSWPPLERSIILLRAVRA
jgi:SAM-dependent methyltransferase